MYRPQNLRIPGPTFVPQSVLAASARPMINHRGPEFASLVGALTPALQDFLRTEGGVLLLTCSGTGGLEAAIANTLSRGDKVVSFSNGAFGERFPPIATAGGGGARGGARPLGRTAWTRGASTSRGGARSIPTWCGRSWRRRRARTAPRRSW